MGERWDQHDLKVGLEYLSELLEQGDAHAAERQGARVRNAVIYDELDVSQWLGPLQRCLQMATGVGGAAHLLEVMVVHAVRTMDIAAFRSLLGHPDAAKALGHDSLVQLPSSFIEVVVARAFGADATFRRAACSLLSTHVSKWEVDLAPAGPFLFACLSDEGTRRDGPAGLAGWLLAEYVRKGGVQAERWRARIAELALGKSVAAAVALQSHARLAVFEEDRGLLTVLFRLRGAQSEAVADGVLSVAKDRRFSPGLEYRDWLRAHLKVMSESGEKKLRIQVAKILEAIR